MHGLAAALFCAVAERHVKVSRLVQLLSLGQPAALLTAVVHAGDLIAFDCWLSVHLLWLPC